MLEGPDHPARPDPTLSKTAKVVLVLVFAIAAVLAVLLFFTGVIAGGGDDASMGSLEVVRS